MGWTIALALAAGIGQGWALAWPGSGQASGIAQCVCMALFICVLIQTRTWQAVLAHGFVYTCAWLVTSTWWLYISMHEYGGMSAWMSVLAVLLLCGALSVYYVLSLWCYRCILHAHLSLLWQVLSFASLWCLAELARATVLTGFPWGAVGYAHVDSPLALLAPQVGVYGVTWCAAALAMLLARAMLHGWSSGSSRRRLRLALGMLMLLLCGYVAPGSGVFLEAMVKSEAHTEVKQSFTLLQANIPQDQKFNGQREEALQWYISQTLQAPSEWVIWPETAIPYVSSELPPAFWQELSQSFARAQKKVIVGIPRFDAQVGYANSAIYLPYHEQTPGYVYDKHHLVPFGETTPQSMRWITRWLRIYLSDFHAGPLAAPPLLATGMALAINICFEDLFGEELAARFVHERNPAPNIFVNMSNIAWFGHTSVVDQHVHIARMRSIEFRRPTVRATNTGGTVAIDASGRVISQLEPFVRGALTVQVPLAQSMPVTLYAQWAGRWSLWPLSGICALLLLGAVWRRRSDK